MSLSLCVCRESLVLLVDLALRVPPVCRECPESVELLVSLESRERE